MIFEKIKQSLKPQKVKKLELIIFFTISIIIITSNIWIRDYFTQISLDLILYLNNISPNLTKTFSNLGFNNITPILLLTFSILILNFCNIFKLLIYHAIIYTAFGITAFLKLLYRHDMIFIYAQKKYIHLEPNICNITWASISLHSVLATCILLTVSNIVVKPNCIWGKKLLVYIASFILILFINFCIFCFYIYSIADLVFSSIIGAIIVIFYINVLKIDFHKSHDLKIFLNRAKFPYLVFNILITLTIIILYIFSYDMFNNTKRENAFFYYSESISHTNCFFKQPDNTNISNDSLIILSIYLSNFSIVYGIYLDLNIINKNDEHRWGFFNFENDQNELQSIYTFSDEVKNGQWNKTSIKINIIRIFIAYITLILCYIPTMFIPIKYNNFFYIIIFFKYFIPNFFYGINLFFLLKIIYIKLNLVKTNAFRIKNKSSNSSVILHEFLENK